MHRRGTIYLAALGTVAALSLALPGGAAAARTKVVYVGPPPSAQKLAAKVLGKHFVKAFGPDANAFFGRRVTIHVGDKVSFLLGGFHTVDIPAKGHGDLPLIKPNGTVNGESDAAGNPFWFDGHVPSLGYDPALFAPTGSTTYDGTARIDSGLPLGSGPAKPLVVKFTQAGSYRFYCDVHPGMKGTVVVKPKGQPVPSPRKDAKALAEQLAKLVLAAKRLAHPQLPKDHVYLGDASRNGVELYAMFPSVLRVKPGTVVTFSLTTASRETHTATFGPKAYLGTLAQGFAGPVIPGVDAYPSGPKAPLTLRPSSHGNGFANTGVLDRDRSTPYGPLSRIKFTTKGVYKFICLVHPSMHGEVIVK